MIKETAETQEIILTKYVTCQYKDGTSITVGRVVDGDYAICIEKNKPQETEIIFSGLLPETNMTALLTSMLIYGERYGINLDEKIKEIVGGDNIFYYCQPNE